MVGDDQHVRLVAGALEQLAERGVEDPVGLRHAALAAALLPVRPGQVVDVVGGHEDDEQELGVVALGQPVHDRHLLLAGAADELEVEPATRVDRERVVEQQAAEALLQLVHELARARHPVLARGRVDPGQREAVHARRRPGEGDVDDPDPAPCERRVQSAGARLWLPLTSRRP